MVPTGKKPYCISKVISITYLKNVSQIFPTLCTACQLQAKACSTQYAELRSKKFKFNNKDYHSYHEKLCHKDSKPLHLKSKQVQAL